MNSRQRKGSVLFALPLLALAPFANASVVFDNGGPNQHNGNEMTDFLQAEDFSLASAAQVTSVMFWNLQGIASDYKGSLYWAIQANSAGTPGAIIASGTTGAVTRSATGMTDTSGTFFEFVDSFSITPTSLAAGTTYWLTLHDGSLVDTNFADFYWEWSNDNGNGQEFDMIANTAWDSNLAEHAFQLGGNAVPEPRLISFLLVAMLLAGSGIRRFQSSRKIE